MNVRAIALAATTATRTWTGVTRAQANESARGGARSVRAFAATIPLSGYGREGLNLRGFGLLAVEAGPLVGDEQPAVRAFESDVPVGAAGHELRLESLAAMRTDDLVGAFRGRGVSHCLRIATRRATLPGCLHSVEPLSFRCSPRSCSSRSSSWPESTRGASAFCLRLPTRGPISS